MIEPIQSERASPVLLVPKKEGTLRFCVDFRRLNALTIPDTYPVPRMEDCIDSLGEARLFTTLDALWGYWQVPIVERDTDNTTFTSHMGTLHYKRMPFRLCNAPVTFRRALDIFLSGVCWKTCLVYIYVEVIFSKTVEDHFEEVSQVLTHLKGAGVKLELKKFFSFYQAAQGARRAERAEHLGHVITPERLRRTGKPLARCERQALLSRSRNCAVSYAHETCTDPS